MADIDDWEIQEIDDIVNFADNIAVKLAKST